MNTIYFQVAVLAVLVVVFIGAVWWIATHNVTVERHFKEPFDIRDHRKTYADVPLLKQAVPVEEDEHEKLHADGAYKMDYILERGRRAAKAWDGKPLRGVLHYIHRGHRHRKVQP